MCLELNGELRLLILKLIGTDTCLHPRQIRLCVLKTSIWSETTCA
uniref:Uncharacterized protein n=1 Tax=Anguilla anguilla TaxID=7936 RepID=A0A0E9UKL2_ANGAN